MLFLLFLISACLGCLDFKAMNFTFYVQSSVYDYAVGPGLPNGGNAVLSECTYTGSNYWDKYQALVTTTKNSTFTRNFYIPGKSIYGLLKVFIDDYPYVYINDLFVSCFKKNRCCITQTCDVTEFLKPGLNVLVIEGVNSVGMACYRYDLKVSSILI
ncbi:hypothetical protein SteCoe_1743 [Stentor coeruleus]|uniref:Fucolectin tachylectin-4 pentraxin-1 domain-containing protein n=1 Tax=Stentor coeruleus TaxID=5963 RepID=A0A1R2D1B3_9CILI|nr:hypothetical protein SteCoe_1743 [Stentor coeruleus]